MLELPAVKADYSPFKVDYFNVSVYINIIPINDWKGASFVEILN
jgi:hypothetical protein